MIILLTQQLDMASSSSDLSATDSKTVEEKLASLAEESEKVWEGVSEKQLMIGRLRGDQAQVSEKFTRFFTITRNLDQSISEDVERFHQYTELNESTQLLSHSLNEFEAKLQRSERIVQDLIRGMRQHFSLLGKVADSMKEGLENQQLPSLKWIEKTADPQVGELVVEWEQLHLEDKITENVRQIEELVGSELVEEILDADMDFI